MQPNFAVALNNRAWAYFRWGKAASGLSDVEASLRLEPTAAHTLDTRTHIRQVMGVPKGALGDYTKAMSSSACGNNPLYQCGLTEAGLYEGRIDGIWRRELTEALRKCARDKALRPAAARREVPIVAIIEAGLCASGPTAGWHRRRGACDCRRGSRLRAQARSTDKTMTRLLAVIVVLAAVAGVSGSRPRRCGCRLLQRGHRAPHRRLHRPDRAPR